MDITAFATAVGRLGALPKDEVRHATDVATRLNDGERDDLLDRLTDMNGELAETAGERGDILTDMQGLADDMERAVREFEQSQESNSPSA
jgi:hypothetical protein